MHKIIQVVFEERVFAEEEEARGLRVHSKVD
jgi:hypothetical protein